MGYTKRGTIQMNMIEDSVTGKAVLDLGVGNVIQALMDNGHWSSPIDDLGPKELLVYVIQIIEAKEIPLSNLNQWVKGDVVEAEYEEIVDEDVSPAQDLYAVVGKLLETPDNVNAILDGLSDQGVKGLSTIRDLGHVNNILVDLLTSGGITLLDLFDCLKPKTAEQSTPTPTKNHIALLAKVYHPLRKDYNIDVNSTMIDSIVDSYIDQFKNSVKEDDVSGITHRYEILFIHDGVNQNIPLNKVLELTFALHERGMYVVSTTGPFEGVGCNRIFVSLTDNYTIVDTPLVVSI